MVHRILRTFAAGGLLAACLSGMSPVARAGLTYSASVGGAPTGVNYVNFDNLPLGATGGISNGITVSFTGDGQAVHGSQSGKYAAPYLSSGNGTLFGDPTDGPDATTYLTTGKGSVKLTLPGEEMYVGLLWGSVDNYNTLSLYNGAALVGTVTGIGRDGQRQRRSGPVWNILCEHQVDRDLRRSRGDKFLVRLRIR